MTAPRKPRTNRAPVLRRRLQNMANRLEAECETLTRIFGPGMTRYVCADLKAAIANLAEISAMHDDVLVRHHDAASAP